MTCWKHGGKTLVITNTRRTLCEKREHQKNSLREEKTLEELFARREMVQVGYESIEMMRAGSRF